MTIKEKTELARSILGLPGAMIFHSKSGFHKLMPAHVPIFNSRLCIEEGTIWYGDLDITVDEPNLIKLAMKLQERLYVLCESDATFENESTPRLDRARFIVEDEHIVVGDSLLECVQRCRTGQLKGKLVYRPELRV